ncbi:MAG: hypothetical protein J3T61_12880, partial [Candidatus Brocadiales bacterium]|nr:hypothetical protein [Candidatus Bathyanammoxibius sp.]
MPIKDLVVIILLILGGVGGLISEAYPIIGVCLISVGILIAVWQYVASAAKRREQDAFNETLSILFARSGFGNIYKQAIFLDLERKGSTEFLSKSLEKALQVDPDDKEALELHAATLAISLSQAARERYFGVSQQAIQHATSVAERGQDLYPSSHYFSDALGILCDVKMDHDVARQWFLKSGRLRNDPYWRLQMATSYGMSGQYDLGLQEMANAVREGAEGWLVDLYFGRALCGVGRYEDAEVYLRKAW